MTAKERLAIPPQPMPEHPPAERVHNMDEVALGYTLETARREASRCLNCPNRPCVAGCPVRVRIPEFLAAVAAGEIDRALEIIRENSLLPAVCGRVCPQEKQCQRNCTVGRMLGDIGKAVAIGRVERFVADHASGVAVAPAPRVGRRRIAVVGSGPASITCAADCARAGHAVVVFEAFHREGGVLVYGIPEFRLPKRIVEREIRNLRAMGVKTVSDFVVGRTLPLSELRRRFDAVFLGVGAGLPRFMDIPGEDLIGVFSANEYLTRANLMKAYREEEAVTPFWHGRQVSVLGGGNVAMDAARMALRLGAESVQVIYRRSEQEMPARDEEVRHAREEGVTFLTLANATRILGDDEGCVTALECLRYELGEPDASGRRRPVAIPGSAFTVPADTVIVAVGSGTSPLLPATEPGLRLDAKGHVIVDPETMMTSLSGVFAGGDIESGAATVILAMGDGRKAADGICRYLAARTDCIGKGVLL